MFDEDEDNEPILLVLGVLAAVIGVVILVFLSGDSALDKISATPAPVEEVAEPEPEVEAAPALDWSSNVSAAAATTAATVGFGTNVDSSYVFNYSAADGTGGTEEGGPGTDFELDLSGLTPDTDYDWDLTLTDSDGHELTDSGTFRTEAEALTPSAVTVALGEAGVTLDGQVPDEATSGEIEAAAISAYGDVVTNNLEVVEGYTNDGGTIRVVGAVGTAAAADAAGAAFEGIAPFGVNNEVEVSTDALVADLNALFLLEPIQFDSGSANIRAESTATLDRAAELLLANEEAAVNIEGHTDDQGDDGFNQVLSQDRAQAVLDYLVGAGVDASRMSAIGFGETTPIGDNSTEEGRQQNRRIEFRLQ